jgi:NADH dehydrogenase
MTHRVVIIGGGFAGLHAALSVGKLPVDVTLVDKRNFHLFQPLLYQVATGGLSPGDITAPLRAVVRKLPNVRVILAEVKSIDPAQHRVILNDGELAYDTLIAAAGADNFYFGNDSWSQYAPPLKSIEDATAMRARILSAFEHAEREPDESKRRAWLRFVIVGGGPTGVELAGAIGEISRDTLRGDFRHIKPEEAQILLLEHSPRLLGQFADDLSASAERQLINLGVRTRTGVKVTGIDSTGVIVDTGQQRERIETYTVLWAAGVRPVPLGKQLADSLGITVDRGGRIPVSKDFSVAGHPEILVMGDMAAYEQDGQMLPGLAAVAMQQGQFAGKIIKARLNGVPPPQFHYADKGTMATIGRAAAVAQFGKVHFTGLIAWLLWLFVHLMLLVGFQNRLLVALQWGFQYLTFNRGARLITQSPDGRDRTAA